MRLFILGLLAVMCFGCATIQIPNYIKGNNPYSRRIYVDFDRVHEAIKDVLAGEHFTVESEVDPSMYERDERYEKKDSKNVLIFTQVKEMNRVLFTKYVHLNVYVRSLSDSVEVEIRYSRLTSVGFSQIKGTRNDAYINHLLDAIEERAGQS